MLARANPSPNPTPTPNPTLTKVRSGVGGMWNSQVRCSPGVACRAVLVGFAVCRLEYTLNSRGECGGVGGGEHLCWKPTLLQTSSAPAGVPTLAQTWRWGWGWVGGWVGGKDRVQATEGLVGKEDGGG